MEVTAPSGVAVVSAGHRSPRPKTRTPNTVEAEQTGDGEADCRRGPSAPRGKPRFVTVDVGKYRPAQSSSRQMAAKQGHPPQGVASSRGSGAVAGTCHLHLAAADHGRCRGDPQPPPPGSTRAQPSSRSRTPKGSCRAARVLATPGPEARPSGSGAAVAKP
ncbi:uncharacterized protein LOC125537259 [Triticum urartu]|uniref:uncharacterized protein LOC125537259 n=1 Tax=Triticum urartu TaxID=4572 RepID=UPI0020444C48|nr:uncharacterized protein LOC125537259 [Triticum urartu]